MAQTLVNFRIDEETKKEMEKVCDELGMTVTTALNIFIKKMTREKRIPFDVSIDPFYSKSNMKAINESIKELEDGKVIVKTLEELEAMENE
ncbi:MAG: type II toxin-antitoxin system RelB/DinJ family antitoxin [Clostridia bacterium]|nr:type II toxin-antitoxin system RelB/DinJ family antitoxin [Clostridia bacterium]MCI9274621.1 type II toxin-antitoxin system RelB/DinJ family antitoxin [Clostridia bacterium]